MTRRNDTGTATGAARRARPAKAAAIWRARAAAVTIERIWGVDPVAEFLDFAGEAQNETSRQVLTRYAGAHPVRFRSEAARVVSESAHDGDVKCPRALLIARLSRIAGAK